MDAPTITAVAACIAAIAGVAGAIRSFFNGSKLQEIHLSTNSRLDQLVSASNARAFSAGQDTPRPPDPMLTKAIAVEAVRVANKP